MTRFRTVTRAAGLAHLAPLSVLLLGCAGPLGTPRPDMSGQSYSGTLFDGTYTGTIHSKSAPGAPKSTCWEGGLFTVNIQGAAFQYVLAQPGIPGQPTVSFTETVDGKGAFTGHSPAGDFWMTGKTDGAKLDATIDSSTCNYTIQADRL